jgi:hypothetical protein
MRKWFCLSVGVAFAAVLFAPTRDARANTGISHAEYQDLVFALKLAPVDTFENYLSRESRLNKLNAPQKQALLKAMDQPFWHRLGYFALNMFVFPGLGSILQGDTVWGIVIGGFVLGGMGLFVWGAVNYFDNNRIETPFTVGMVIYMTGGIMSWIRPWVFDAPRHKMLEGHYIQTMRLAPPSVRVTPIVLPPLALGRGQEALSPSRTLGFGLGLVGAF